MKTIKISGLLLWSIVVLATLTQCRKEAVVPAPVVPPVVTPGGVPASTEVNNFIWSNMHDWYLWNDNIPAITNAYYQPLTTSSPNYKRNLDSLNTFLNKYKEPRALFYDLLYQYEVVDKWSFIVSNYDSIFNWESGISKTVGCDFMLYRLSDVPTNLVGVVRYVWKDSPAELAGIQRGDLFTKVDGVQLTIDNYKANLINKESYSLAISKLVGNVVTPTGKNVALTAVTMQEDPVLINKVLTVNGNKVGYLVYNAFNSGNDPTNSSSIRKFDLELNTVFQQFKTAGISKLILDLRYNGGGDVETAQNLASMIYTTNTSKLFAKSVYNDILTQELPKYYGTGFNLFNFTDKISGTSINTLNLTEIYFIASGESASASELLINGLKPYMNVKSIGTNTVGKYVASTTLQDYDSNGKLVTTHKYAMQPIYAKIANSLGVSDFVNGLTPDISASEDIGNMLPLGDENETLLKTTLDYIKGLKSQSLINVSSLANSKPIFGSKDKIRFSKDMFVDTKKFMQRTR